MTGDGSEDLEGNWTFQIPSERQCDSSRAKHKELCMPRWKDENYSSKIQPTPAFSFWNILDTVGLTDLGYLPLL